MRLESKVECKNLKIRIRFTKDIDLRKLKDENVKVFERNACIILKRLKTTVTIYKHSKNTLHVTGIRSGHQWKEFVKYILIKLKQCAIEYKVDNSMFSCKMKDNVNLKKIVETLSSQSPYFCVYTSSIFPALFLKPKKDFKEKSFPTILIFRTGSFILLGGKEISTIREVAYFVKSLLNKA